MNIDEQNFQKRLVVWQLLATIFVAIGAVMFTYGQTLDLFASELSMDAINETEETASNLQIMAKIFSKAGAVYTITGAILIFGSPILFILRLVTEKVEPKKTKYSKLKILADEMYDGKDLELKEQGYDA